MSLVKKWYKFVSSISNGLELKKKYEPVSSSVFTEEQVQALVSALIFYADPETYFAIGFFPDRPCGPFMEDFCNFTDKPGKLANDVLDLLCNDTRINEMYLNAIDDLANIEYKDKYLTIKKRFVENN